MSTTKQFLPPYFGGKATLARSIIDLMPAHKCYVEPFGGFASILLNKPPAPYTEFYNDLNGDVANLFKVLRDDFKKLERILQYTEFGRDVFVEALRLLKSGHGDRVKRAWAILVMHEMSIKAIQRGSSFGNGGARYEGSKARKWSARKKTLAEAAQRLQDIVIENRPALELCQKLDSPGTLFLLDPPYPFEVRGEGKKYKHEIDAGEHIELIKWAEQAEGMIMLCSYRNELYDRLLAKKWQLVEFKARSNAPGTSQGYLQRTEAIYINPRAQLPNRLFR